jgi:hypothetical protein
MSNFLGNFKVKKNLSETPLTEWNSLTPKLIILVTEISIKIDFFSLLLESRDLSLLSQFKDYLFLKKKLLYQN